MIQNEVVLYLENRIVYKYITLQVLIHIFQKYPQTEHTGHILKKSKQTYFITQAFLNEITSTHLSFLANKRALRPKKNNVIT